MDRYPVVSSNLVSVGFDLENSVLEVEFGGGAVYQYFDVPPTVFDGLMGATSKGNYLWANIRGQYRYARI